MKFADIPGLASIKQRLIQSVKNGKVAHAQLFSGKPGTLNLPLALAYTTYLHCQNRTDTDSCGSCPACSKSQKYVHPDTHFVFPLGNVKGDKDEDRFKADILKTWRTFLLDQPFGNIDDWAAAYGGEDKMAIISREESREIIRTLSLKSFESPFKIMIIWLPEYMHPSAANGILKILEEPPANTFFLLVSNAAERMLPTIISRLQIVTVPLLSDDEVEGWLKQFTDDDTKLAQAVQLAEGDPNAARKLLDAEEDHHQQRFADWMRACFKKEYGKLVSLADEFHESDKMMQRNFLQYSLGMLRETLLHRSGAPAINRVKGGELKFIQDFSKVMTPEKIETSGRLISESSVFLERNGSAKMIFLDLSLQVSKMF
ncbi:MAG TPA: DNA polymerase III subunit delta [Cyclobacteriaceae bacterium]|nr:DNA polymerase III subunit delta [Cyclobacteriaceae bacterium]